ncbi:uncharacterized protein LOC135217866 [Macrobrachium nipponense]|uniref:uncharacterized protein LOC135217866 n=1 Tax=Macrobrachium nipponense TaxID=159736 RepID=UPI0030C86879
MASVLKRFHNFKSNQFHGGACGEKRSQSPVPSTEKGPVGEAEADPECPIPSELLHRRKVSISKSGRYRENHKKRCALLDETKKELQTQAKTTPSSSSDKDDLRTMGSLKDKAEKNKENEKNRENIIVRRDSIISDTDGHAVADEIESLAKTLCIENALETAL